ncbi:hypothetical protein ACGFRG_07985 [Streptomyces sp. NPDC048696]|uniref:hypothetical protein n=1 Tax=Streptomyces sp. NPDC048696 TaxID=3365585 RepID=UPI0037134BF4
MTREALLLTAEVLFVLLALLGVALICFPLGLITGGVIGVLVVERAALAQPDDQAKETDP